MTRNAITAKISLKDKQYFERVKEKTGRKNKSSLIEQVSKDNFHTIIHNTEQYIKGCEQGKMSEGRSLNYVWK